MNKLFFIRIVAALAVLVSVGCSDKEDVLPAQRERIVSFLERTHVPHLVEESQVEPDTETPFYTVTGDAAYRYVVSQYNPDRVNWPEVTSRSKVSIDFRLYVLEATSAITQITDKRLPEYSNEPGLKAAYEAAGLNTEYWSFEPLVIDMRKSDILKGLRSALVGCRQGDQVEVYMTYNMAYGDEYFGVVPKQSPLAVMFSVKEVE